jgi:transcriptional regulator with XRE-family HTH domain
MNQTELGTLLGITYQQVQKYESGANRISASRLQKIAQVLGVSEQFFFEGLISQEGAPTMRELAVAEFLLTRQGRSLARSFTRIADMKLRSAIVALVCDIAGPAE